MLSKRLIGTVTVRRGLAVQSFGYQYYLPLGKPECLVENLDRWGADEILIQDIDRTSSDSGPNIELIKKISACNISTPIIYAGGITSAKEAVNVIQSGAERVCIDSLLHSNPAEVCNIAAALGTQAVLASIPVAMNKKGKPCWYNYNTQKLKTKDLSLAKLLKEKYLSELIIIDKEHEGTPNGFNFNLLPFINDIDVPAIIFGGLNNTDQLKKLLIDHRISAVAVGNFLNYKEHSIQSYKKKLTSMPIRPPSYTSWNVI